MLSKKYIKSREAEAIKFIKNKYNDASGTEDLFEKELKSIIELAGNGELKGMYQLAYLYRKGDRKQAFKWFLRTAMTGNMFAMHELDDMYRYGNIHEKNLEEAEKWRKRGIRASNAIYMTSQGDIYIDGNETLNIKQDKERAFKCYKTASNYGNPEAMYKLAMMYLRRDKNKDNSKEAVKWLKKSANKGYLKSMYELGYIYYWGFYIGFESDLKVAFHWLNKASNGGCIKAMKILVMMGYNRKGTKKLFEEIIKAGNKGDLDAMRACAKLYYRRGNKEKAAKWYKKAAKIGDAEAMFEFGLLQYNGNGLKENRKQAITWYKKSAKGGYVYAMTALADIYLKGLGGVEKNKKEWSKWSKMSGAIYHKIRIKQAEANVEEKKKFLKKALAMVNDESKKQKVVEAKNNLTHAQEVLEYIDSFTKNYVDFL